MRFVLGCGNRSLYTESPKKQHRRRTRTKAARTVTLDKTGLGVTRAARFEKEEEASQEVCTMKTIAFVVIPLR